MLVYHENTTPIARKCATRIFNLWGDKGAFAPAMLVYFMKVPKSIKRLAVCFPVMVFISLVYCAILFGEPAIFPLEENTRIYQPGEKAIVAFNGEREAIILQQYIKSNRFSKAVRIFPFPSEVDYALADPSIFRKIKKLSRKKKLEIKKNYQTPLTTFTKRRKNLVQFIIKDRALTKPFNSFSVKAKNRTDLFDRLDAMLKEKNLPRLSLLNGKKAIFDTYFEKKYNFFTIDMIQCRPKTRRTSPVSYCFETQALYFPMGLSQVFERPGTITLFLIYPTGGLEKGWAKRAGGNWDISREASVSLNELRNLNSLIGNLFHTQTLKLRVFRFRGSFDSLSDVTTGSPSSPPPQRK